MTFAYSKNTFIIVSFFSTLLLLAACGSGENTLPKNVRPVQLEFFEIYPRQDLQGNWELACRAQEASDTSALSGAVPMDELESRKLRNMLYSDASNQFFCSFGSANKRDMEKISSILEKPEIKRCFPDDVLFLWSLDASERDGNYSLFAIKVPYNGKAVISGKDMTNTEVYVNEVQKSPVIRITMNKKGQKNWAVLTERNVGRCIAITVDRKVISCPIVNEPITGNSTEISGSFSLKEAEELAAGINAGK